MARPRRAHGPGPFRIVLGLLAATALVLAGSSFAGAAVTIRFQYNWYNTSSWTPAYQAMVDAFNRTHTDIQVDGYATAGTYDKLETEIAGGTPPDVVNFENSAVIEWAAKGLLEPMDTLFTSAQLRSTFFTSDADEDIWHGRVWGMPGYTNVRGLFWNTELFAEVGLDPQVAPASMSALDDLARKGLKIDANGRIARVGFLPWNESYQAGGWFWTFGGQLYDPATGEPTLDNPQNIQAWEWEQEWAKRYPVAQMAQALAGHSNQTYFINSALLATTGADNFAATIARDAPKLDFRTGRVPHPVGGHNGTWGGGTGYIIPKGAKHIKGAETFLRWVATDGLKILYTELGQFPTSLSAAEWAKQQVAPDDRRMPLFDQMGERNARPPLWANVVGQLRTLERSQIITLKANPRDVLSNLQRQLLPQYAGLK